ncbi:hypothetical protein V7128_26130 [Neobacillus vireti]|uniref:hypothetical protein n=1 Tax=Neobacillus vireti TaxID=220686 RepID=UPI003000A99A
MKALHETQSTETGEISNMKDENYSPIENLQKIEGGGNREKVNLKKLPAGIRYIGYFIIGFSVISIILMFILNFIF